MYSPKFTESITGAKNSTLDFVQNNVKNSEIKIPGMMIPSDLE